MAEVLTRQTHTVFGLSGSTSNFAQFGSQAASAPIKTKDIATIQALGAWADGWQEAVALGEAPYLEDMNGAMYEHSYQTGYILQEGIAAYDAGTTYNVGSVVKLPYTGTQAMQLFVSKIDANTGNALPTAPASNSDWQFLEGYVGGVLVFGSAIGFGDTSTQGVKGTTTNDLAAAGMVGELIKANLLTGSAVTGAPGRAFLNVISIDLTAGDWDISAILCGNANGATVSAFEGAISQFANNTQTDQVIGVNDFEMPGPTGSANIACTFPCVPLQLAAPATIYLKVSMNFGSGSPKAFGSITARRVR